jgi:hypothetical protein
VDQRIVIQKDGSFNVSMTIEFTGLACGQPANLTFRVTGQGDFATNDFNGTYAVIGPADVGQRARHVLSRAGDGRQLRRPGSLLTLGRAPRNRQA